MGAFSLSLLHKDDVARARLVLKKYLASIQSSPEPLFIRKVLSFAAAFEEREKEEFFLGVFQRMVEIQHGHVFFDCLLPLVLRGRVKKISPILSRWFVEELIR